MQHFAYLGLVPLQEYLQQNLDKNTLSSNIPEGFNHFHGSCLMLFRHELTRAEFRNRVCDVEELLQTHKVDGMEDPFLHEQIVRLSQLVMPKTYAAAWTGKTEVAWLTVISRYPDVSNQSGMNEQTAAWDNLMRKWARSQQNPRIGKGIFVPEEADLVESIHRLHVHQKPELSLKLTLSWGYGSGLPAGNAVGSIERRLTQGIAFLNKYRARELTLLRKVLVDSIARSKTEIPNAELLLSHVNALRELYVFRTFTYRERLKEIGARKALILHVLDFMAKHALWANPSGSAITVALDHLREFSVDPVPASNAGYDRASRRIDRPFYEREKSLVDLLNMMMNPVRADERAKAVEREAIADLAEKIDERNLRPSLYRRAAQISDLKDCVWVRKTEVPKVNPLTYRTDLEDTLSRKVPSIAVNQGPIDMQLSEFLIYLAQAGDNIKGIKVRVPRTFMFVGYTTSVVDDSVPLFEWDGYKDLPRNPTSFYTYGEATSCRDVSLIEDKFAEVTAVVGEPWFGFGTEASAYFDKKYGSVYTLLLDGCIDRTAPRMDFPQVYLSQNQRLKLDESDLVALELYGQQSLLIDWQLSTANGMALATNTMVYLTMNDDVVFAINVVVADQSNPAADPQAQE